MAGSRFGARRTTQNAWKYLQRQLITCMSTKYGVVLLVVLLLLTAIVSFEFGELAIKWSRNKYVSQFGPMKDNIAGRSFEDRMCLPLPIDVVYTWVNGSDPKLLKDLAILKHRLEVEKNMTLEAERTAAELKRLEEEVAAENSTETTLFISSIITSDGAFQTTTSNLAMLSDNATGIDAANDTTSTQDLEPLWLNPYIVQSDLAAVLSDLSLLNITGSQRETILTEVFEEYCGSIAELEFSDGDATGIVHFDEKEALQDCLDESFLIGNLNVTLSAAYSVANSTVNGLVLLPQELGLGMGFGFAAQPYRSVLLTEVPNDLSDEVVLFLLQEYGHVIGYVRQEDVIAVTFETRFAMIDVLSAGILKIHRAKNETEWKLGHVTHEDLMERAKQTLEEEEETGIGPQRVRSPNVTFSANSTLNGTNSTVATTPQASTTTVATSTNTDSATVNLAENITNYEIMVLSVVEVGAVLGARNHTYMSLIQHKGDDSSSTEAPQKDGNDAMSQSRFQDNSELKYSLRSIERNAPWVRNIYIVTNGQIPSWLNLDHPRIQVVSHEEIFLNTSHLPTFSSPSIETHLHRIPGLSKKFLYLNDDVMFGTEVWPDDFYTHAKGQRVYLAWPVPNCAEGCPSNWISDKYCDNACNNEACDFDGGDCVGKESADKGYNDWQGSQGHTASSTSNGRCTAACQDQWMGDKYCDSACNNYNCGFDTGDCSMDPIIRELQQLMVYDDTQILKQNNISLLRQDGTFPRALYLNLTQVNHTISEGSHDNPDAIATAVFLQEERTLVLVFRPEVNATDATIELRDGEHHVMSFNVTIDTAFQQSEDDLAELVFVDTPIVERNNTEKVAFIVSNGTIINAWDIPENVTQTQTPTKITITTAETTKRPKSRVYKVPEIPADVILPLSIQDALKEIEEELANEEITHKGYSKLKYFLLLPYASNNTIQGNDDLFHVNDSAHYGRHLLQAEEYGDDFEGRPLHLWPDNKPKPVVTGGLVWRRGKLIDATEAYVADWIADTKRKQLSYPKDLADSIEKWEERTGMKWDPTMRNSAEKTKYIGWLPWERRHLFDHLVDGDETDGYMGTERWTQRQLQDTFGDSLKFVNALYNKKFGFQQRKVIAHMPHMIDKDIVELLETDFPDEWNATSSHSLRSSKDMQYAFAYFYYLIGLTHPFDYEKEFDHIDVDRDGLLSVHELRTLITRVYPLPTTADNWEEFENILLNCSHLQPPMKAIGVGVGPDAQEVWVTKTLLRNCTRLQELWEKAAGDKHVYKHELDSDEHDIAFQMIRDNATDVGSALDSIRRSPKKFVCLNDNIDHSLPTAYQVVDRLHEFYEAMFPLPSQFELAPGYKNRFLHKQDLLAWQHRQATILKWARYALMSILGLFLVSSFWKKILQIRRSWFSPRARISSPSRGRAASGARGTV